MAIINPNKAEDEVIVELQTNGWDWEIGLPDQSQNSNNEEFQGSGKQELNRFVLFKTPVTWGSRLVFFSV